MVHRAIFASVVSKLSAPRKLSASPSVTGFRASKYGPDVRKDWRILI